MNPGTLTLQIHIEEIPEKLTLSWDDVADDVFVDWNHGNDYTMLLNQCLRDEDKSAHQQCNLRFSDKWNNWRGGECPLPEGVMVGVEFRDQPPKSGPATSFDWILHARVFGEDIIAYRVTGLAEGYIYPDEAES